MDVPEPFMSLAPGVFRMSLHVVGIAGSLRAGSFNRALLAAAVELAPAGMSIEVADLRPIPFYDGDVEAAGVPAPVADLIARVRAADALLIATPEYNYSMPAVLKNAIDWISRGKDSALAGKPAAVMGASPGGFGTVRSQLALRQVAYGVNMPLLLRPEVHVAKAAEKFDAAGRLSDEPTRASIAALLVALAEWARTHGAKA
jgi:chromate reductase